MHVDNLGTEQHDVGENVHAEENQNETTGKACASRRDSTIPQAAPEPVTTWCADWCAGIKPNRRRTGHQGGCPGNEHRAVHRRRPTLGNRGSHGRRRRRVAVSRWRWGHISNHHPTDGHRRRATTTQSEHRGHGQGCVSADRSSHSRVDPEGRADRARLADLPHPRGSARPLHATYSVWNTDTRSHLRSSN